MIAGDVLRFSNRVESLAVAGNAGELVLASLSTITGNSWRGQIRAIEGSEASAAVSMPCSVGDIDSRGPLVACAGDDGDIHVLNLTHDSDRYAFTPNCALRDHDALVSSVAFSPLDSTQQLEA